MIYFASAFNSAGGSSISFQIASIFFLFSLDFPLFASLMARN